MSCRTADYLLSMRRQSTGAPPFIGLLPLDEGAYKRALDDARQFLNGQTNRLATFFSTFPNLAT